MSLSAGAMSLSGCATKKESEAAQVDPATTAAANKSLEEIKTRIGKLREVMADLRTRVNALPGDMPGTEPVRSKLFSVDEVLGVEAARAQWLTGELNKAVAAGNPEQVAKVSEMINGADRGSNGFGKDILELTHQLMSFERRADQYRALIASGAIFTRVLPTGDEITASKDSLEKQLLDFIDNGKKKADKKTSFTFDHVSFDAADAQLDIEKSREQIDNVVAILKAFPRVKVEIGVYTDDSAPPAAAKELSAARAKTLTELLVAKGVAAPRLTAQGFGPTHPVCPKNDTEDCKAQNRRTALRVTAK
ncbi:MAG TPA: OmpA family protein [Polyangia bacterium]